MSADGTYLAVFLGSNTSPQMSAWNALPEAERRAKGLEGIAAWKAWAEEHHAAIVRMGGPLGRTKKVTPRGIEDTSNEMGGYMIVRADFHEAAAKLFERHPHFVNFPGRVRGDHACSAYTGRLGDGFVRAKARRRRRLGSERQTCPFCNERRLC